MAYGDLILLRVPPGAADADISHGTESFRTFLKNPSDPKSQTLVRVPPHAAAHFIQNAGFEMVNETQAPAPAGMAILAHPEGPIWPDGSPRIINGIAPMPNPEGGYFNRYPTPAGEVPGMLPHGLDAEERVAEALKAKLEALLKEKLDLVDATDVEGEIAAAVKQAVAQAEADRDVAVQRAEHAEQALVALEGAVAAAQENASKAAQHAAELQDEIAATKKDLSKVIDKAGKDTAALNKDIAALNAAVDAKERQITELLNKAEAASKKK